MRLGVRADRGLAATAHERWPSAGGQKAEAEADQRQGAVRTRPGQRRCGRGRRRMLCGWRFDGETQDGQARNLRGAPRITWRPGPGGLPALVPAGIVIEVENVGERCGCRGHQRVPSSWMSTGPGLPRALVTDDGTRFHLGAGQKERRARRRVVVVGPLARRTICALAAARPTEPHRGPRKRTPLAASCLFPRLGR